MMFALVKNLLFFSYTLKWCTILFYVNKTSCIFIPFYPLSCFGIKDLSTSFHCSIAMSVSGRWICSHLYSS